MVVRCFFFFYKNRKRNIILTALQNNTTIVVFASNWKLWFCAMAFSDRKDFCWKIKRKNYGQRVCACSKTRPDRKIIIKKKTKERRWRKNEKTNAKDKTRDSRDQLRINSWIKNIVCICVCVCGHDFAPRPDEGILDADYFCLFSIPHKSTINPNAVYWFWLPFLRERSERNSQRTFYCNGLFWLTIWSEFSEILGCWFWTGVSDECIYLFICAPFLTISSIFGVTSTHIFFPLPFIFN